MMSTHLQPLDKQHRNKLEATVKKARDVAEEAARAACRQLGVGQARPDAHLTDEEKDQRRRLRIHGRQLGDERDPKKETQQVDRLVEEIAYEHWHRMLFARFLAENDLLMYPDPDDPVAVSIEDCNELAADEGAKNGWELAARFAAKMLPQIFRVDSPVFALTLPPEKQQQLERLLAELPDEVFTASDSLGWVYQFWQAEAKKRINESEVKIGARELPAVTQLFTEPYMVSFLLDNSLGAWWAARRLTDEDFRTAKSEQELRDKAALPGVPLDYLRFVWVDPADDAQSAKKSSGSLPFGEPPRTSGDSNMSGKALAAGLPPSTLTSDPPAASAVGSQSASDVPQWRPAAGTFNAWPESLSELKTLDPCCGSGHFLVAALLMLAPMRMEREGLSASEAVDRVLSENLHGLEIDQRCVELAAFALALAAWRFPEGGGYRVLPDLNVACCGLSLSVSKEEWTKLAGDNNQLRIALDWMYDEFQDAPVLGSLLNPAKSMATKVINWDELSPLLLEVLANEGVQDTKEAAVVAFGLAKAAFLLSREYHLVITNVPYKKSAEMIAAASDYFDDKFKESKLALETVFLERCLDFNSSGGVSCLVMPQNWLFLTSYKKLRNKLLKSNEWNFVARLGSKSFSTPMWDFNVQLLTITKSLGVSLESSIMSGVDVSKPKSTSEKATSLKQQQIIQIAQSKQLSNPDARITFNQSGVQDLLSSFAEDSSGCLTSDGERFYRHFFEVSVSDEWELLQTTVRESKTYDGRDTVILWQQGRGDLFRLAESVKHLNHAAQNWRRGQDVWGKKGVAISSMSGLAATLYDGFHFDNNTAAIVPKTAENLPALWCYCASGEFHDEVRQIDQALKVTNATLVKVPFDLAHWQQVASEKYPHGLPEPYSDDPRQWLFHGHPASSDHALQVAVARLLGYRWPAELDEEMELATDARAWVERSSQLTDLADDDGIVCLPAVGSEQPAEGRLQNLLHRAYEDGRAQEQVFREKLDAADENDPVTVDLWRRGWQPSLPATFNDWLASLLEDADHAGKTLDSWLHEKFFTQHCKRFNNRPFIWHVWDGLKDGFSVLINYHKLDNRLLKTLIYTYLNDWITRQKKDKDAGVDGSEEKLAAAEWLKQRLELILHGEAPHDIFVRWKPLEEQPIGWNPDLNDGVRLNIRPWLTVGDVKKRGAGLFRDKPTIHWKKDRGKDVESAPWYHLGPEYGGKEGDRINDHHLTLAEKEGASS